MKSPKLVTTPNFAECQNRWSVSSKPLFGLRGQPSPRQDYPTLIPPPTKGRVDFTVRNHTPPPPHDPL